MLKRAIGKADNRGDMEIHVKKELGMSDRLRRLFEMCKVKPVEYFHNNANGVFLWVLITLYRLQKIKSRSEFQNSMQSFRKTSQRMDTNIMQQLDENYKWWIREIMRWVAMAER
jgi:hypothetical protein